MRTALFVLVVFSGCTAQDMCRSLVVGTTMKPLPSLEVTATTDTQLRMMLSPPEQAPFSHWEPSPAVWDIGPAEEAMCCATQQAGQPLGWCSAEQLSLLDAPYTDLEHPSAGDATFCFVALQGDRIVAVWHRDWS